MNQSLFSRTNLSALSIVILAMLFSGGCKSAKERLSDEIKAGEIKLFNDTVKILNVEEANEVLKKYVMYADSYNADTASASFLFKAGDLANGLHRPEESIALFERLRVSYPDHKKAAAALFMEGFIYETALQNKEKAKIKYRDFLIQYPAHPLAASAKASIDQLNANLSDEDLIKMFEKNQK